MRKLLFILSFILIISSPNSKANNIEIDKNLELTDRYKSQSPKKFENSLQSLNNLRSTMSAEQKAYLSYLHAYSYTYTGDYERAKREIEGTLALSKDVNLQTKTEALLLNIYTASQEWELATQKAAQILKYNSKVHPDASNLAIINAAAFYIHINQYELANMVLLGLKESTLSPRNLCIKYQLKLSAQLSNAKGHVSPPDLDKGINYCETANESLFKSLILTYKAELDLRNNLLNEALTTLGTSEELIENTQYAQVIVKANNIQSEAFFKLGNLQKARYYANKAIQLIDKVKHTKQAIDTFRLNYIIAEQTGDIQLALDFHKKYLAAERAYMDETTSRHLAFHMANQRDLESQNRINLLNAENARLSSSKKLSEEERQNFYLLSSLLLFIVAALVLWLVYASNTNRKFKQLAEQDFLTGISNRRKFLAVAKKQLARAREKNYEISCILFDLDHFKKINDTFGHAIGDQVIRKAVEACKPALPEESIFARVGGEEFVVLMPKINIEVAEYIANQCKESLKKINHEIADLTVTVTASFGVTSTSNSSYDIDEVLADADGAMYGSKNMGRNLVTVNRN